MAHQTSRFALTAAMLGLLSARHSVAAAEDSAYTVTPYRPTVSTPANLSTPGWLEMEWGLQRSADPDASHRDSLPYSVKLALSPDWGVRVGGELWVQTPDDRGQRVTGTGDTSLVLKRRFALDDQSALGLEVGTVLATAPTPLHSGSGRSDYTVTGIYSSDFMIHWHTDLNLGLTQQGAKAPGTAQQQLTWAAAISHDLGAGWGFAGELSGTRQSGAAATRQWLIAASFSPVSALTLDAGLAHALGGAGPSWSVFAGATLPLAKIF